MNKLLKVPIGSKILLSLTLATAALAHIGCKSASSSGTGSGVSHASTQETKALLASPLQSLPRNPLQYQIAMQTQDLAARDVLSRYDQDLLDITLQSWYRLLDSTPNVTGKGKVVVGFRLRSSGGVSDVQTAASTVDKNLAVICEKAVLDVAPFPSWSEEMRRSLPNESRAVTFTFYFN